jgi:hypothetical protein
MSFIADLRAATNDCTPEERDRFALKASYEGDAFAQARAYLQARAKKPAAPLTEDANIKLRKDLAHYDLVRAQLTKSKLFRAYRMTWMPNQSEDEVLDTL